MSDPPRPKVPTHDAASSERAALEAMLAEEEARGQLLEAERASVRARVEVLRTKLASRDPPLAAHPENGAPARSPPRSAGEKVKLFRELFRGRDDLYPTRFVSKKTGRRGYAPACSNKFVAGLCELPKVKCGDCANQAFRRIDDAAVLRHLRGEHVMGAVRGPLRQAPRLARIGTARALQTHAEIRPRARDVLSGPCIHSELSA